MERKTLKRTVIALFVLAVVFFSGNTRAAMQEKDTAAAGSMISAVCSGEGLHAAAVKCRDLAALLTERVIETAGYIAGGTSYGEPIDEEFSGDSTSVYAVAGGEVTSVGENEEIGKYIKITHGEKGESLYGNLSTTGVKVPSRVKKGQIIGTYEKSDEKQFYYSFREFE